MAIKLHRCKNIWVKGPHPCWKVQRALDEVGINYEIVKEKYFGPREETVSRTGQKRFPWIEFEDGSVYREESKEMAQRINEGKLTEATRSQPPSASATA
jgi:glutathione S-transferase